MNDIETLFLVVGSLIYLIGMLSGFSFAMILNMRE